jgi:MoxR-like ATPase
MVTRHSLPRTLADLDTLAFAEPLDVDELAAVATSFRASLSGTRGFVLPDKERLCVGEFICYASEKKT